MIPATCGSRSGGNPLVAGCGQLLCCCRLRHYPRDRRGLPPPISGDLVRAAIGDLTARPRSRAAIRESLDRLWSLRLFSDLWVEEVSEAGGLRLRFHLVRRHSCDASRGRAIRAFPRWTWPMPGDSLWAAMPARTDSSRPSKPAGDVCPGGLFFRSGGHPGARRPLHERPGPDHRRPRRTEVSDRQRGNSRRHRRRGYGPSQVAQADAGDEYGERATRERVQHLEDELRKDGTSRLGFAWPSPFGIPPRIGSPSR